MLCNCMANIMQMVTIPKSGWKLIASVSTIIDLQDEITKIKLTIYFINMESLYVCMYTRVVFCSVLFTFVRLVVRLAMHWTYLLRVIYFWLSLASFSEPMRRMKKNSERTTKVCSGAPRKEETILAHISHDLMVKLALDQSNLVTSQQN